MGAEQKRRECVKSSWESKTCESQVLDTSRHGSFCDSVSMKLETQIRLQQIEVSEMSRGVEQDVSES